MNSNYLRNTHKNQKQSVDADIQKSLELQFAEYVSGGRKSFDLKTLGIHSDLRELNGTVLQKLVWQELLKIPYGRTLTYSELAQKVGKPKAVRAVASAVAKNPLYVVIPCHRVLPRQKKHIYNRASDRPIDIGNYALGANIKKALLEIERAI